MNITTLGACCYLAGLGRAIVGRLSSRRSPRLAMAVLALQLALWPPSAARAGAGLDGGADLYAGQDVGGIPAAYEGGPSTHGKADDYQQAWAGATEAESHGDLDGAALVLAVLLPRYPQDLDLRLRLGWLHLRAGHPTLAERDFRGALVLGGAGSDAELGLGWTLLKLGRKDEAHGHFAALLNAHPDQREAEAETGLRLCESVFNLPWRFAPQIVQGVYLYQNHPVLSYALATTPTLDVLFAGRWFAAATYRYSYFATGDGVTANFSQHDLYLSGGLAGSTFGLALRYALTVDGSGAVGSAQHVGLSARYSPLGDFLLNMSASFYGDMTVLRGELAWRMPIALGLSLRPGIAVQWDPAEVLRTASLTLRLDRPLLSLWIGGKYGDEVRPAYLDVSFIYDILARIPYGLWAGVAVRPGQGLSILFTYALDDLLFASVTPNLSSTVHYLNLGLSKEF